MSALTRPHSPRTRAREKPPENKITPHPTPIPSDPISHPRRSSSPFHPIQLHPRRSLFLQMLSHIYPILLHVYAPPTPFHPILIPSYSHPDPNPITPFSTPHLYGHIMFPSELPTATTRSPCCTAPLRSAGLPGTIPATTTPSASPLPEGSQICSRISPGGLRRVTSKVCVTDFWNLGFPAEEAT